VAVKEALMFGDDSWDESSRDGWIEEDTLLVEEDGKVVAEILR
jgi:hypothetical protein